MAADKSIIVVLVNHVRYFSRGPIKGQPNTLKGLKKNEEKTEEQTLSLPKGAYRPATDERCHRCTGSDGAWHCLGRSLDRTPFLSPDK